MDDNRCVMIVDDEEVFCKILDRRLRSFGYETRYATSAMEALEIAREVRPDVFLLDWMMPDMDGLELAQAIRKEPGLEGSYIIILTAKSGSAETAEALENGADEFLTKPVDDDELKARVRAGFRIACLYHDISIKKLKLEDVNTMMQKKNMELDISQKQLEESNRKLQKHTDTLEGDKKTLEKLLGIAPQFEASIDDGQKLRIPQGKIYYLDEERPLIAFNYFSSMVHHNMPGLGITRSHPSEIRKQFSLEMTPLVWLTQQKSSEEMMLLPDTTKFSSVVTSFLSKSEGGVVAIEGLEYLISQTEFEAVLKLIQFLNDKIMGTSNIIILSMDMEILDTRQSKFLKRELTDMDRISSEMLLDHIQNGGGS